MTAQTSPCAVAGPRGSQAATVLASLARNPLQGYVRLSARYGDTIRLPYSPGHNFYLLSRPEHAEHVLAANQDNYVKAVTYRPLRALIGDGLLTSEGDRWRQHRRLIQPVFSRRHVATFGPVMTDAARRLAARWDSVPDGAEINVAAQMNAVTLDIAGQALFGSDLSGDAAMMGQALDAGQRVATLAAFAPVSWGPRSTRVLKGLARRVGHTAEGIEGPVGRIVSARRAAADGPALGNAADDGRPMGRPADSRGDGPAVEAPGDLLDVLLEARAQDGSPLTDAEIADEVATFLLAGHETTANTLSWSLALLSAYPSARQQLEAELDSVLGDRDPDPGDADRLPWTRAVVAEAMRLYPPAWTIERNALADDEVCGVPVEAGSLVAIPPYLVHRHPEFWPDPAGFDPHRFVGDDPVSAQAGPARHRYAYIPFGGGRRACVGASFAELETVLVLATMARRYRLELTVRGFPAPYANITLRPGRTVPMRLLRRG
jgi:cytochrome P450